MSMPAIERVIPLVGQLPASIRDALARRLREVAWLKLGSCTDHVINAAEATPDSAIRHRPAISRRRRASASRIEAGSWQTRGMTRSIAGMLMGPCD